MEINFYKTLEELDNEIWETPAGEFTSLVTAIHQLRKKPLKDFTIEDLRITIGQNLNLTYLIPLAIGELQENILAEGNFYQGDLLKNVLDSDTGFWLKNKYYWDIVIELFKKNKEVFESDDSYRQIRKSFERFEQINK
ncbi:MAG TPA: contact-dependent growth inhibition system immunity protein [Chitinophagaceae bacterium]|nr:contact-dependent growth inhibition system immunity protein [Chitinophagaceae bacterium]